MIGDNVVKTCLVFKTGSTDGCFLFQRLKQYFFTEIYVCTFNLI